MLHVYPKTRIWARKQYFLASNHMRLDRSWVTEVDVDDLEKVRKDLYSSKPSRWKWEFEDTYENPLGKSKDIEPVSEQEAMDLLHAYKVHLNLNRLHFIS